MKYLWLAALSYLALVLQFAVVSQLNINAGPDLSVALLCCFAVLGGPWAGVAVGIGLGLAYEMLAFVPAFSVVAPLALAGLLGGYWSRRWPAARLGWVALAVTVAVGLQGLWLGLAVGQGGAVFSPWQALGRVILPQVLWTIAVAELMMGVRWFLHRFFPRFSVLSKEPL